MRGSATTTSTGSRYADFAPTLVLIKDSVSISQALRCICLL
jgi:hypothetical protein